MIIFYAEFDVMFIIKSTEVQNPRRNKCSAVVEKNCLLAKYEYHVP